MNSPLRYTLVAKDAQPYLLAEAVEMEVLDIWTRVVHLPHPGIVMKNDDWRGRHQRWNRKARRDLGKPSSAGSCTSLSQPAPAPHL